MVIVKLLGHIIKYVRNTHSVSNIYWTEILQINAGLLLSSDHDIQVAGL